MTGIILLFLIAAIIGGSIGYRLGWNAKVAFDERRSIDAAKKKAEADKI